MNVCLPLSAWQGASTPDKVVEDILERIFQIKEGMRVPVAR